MRFNEIFRGLKRKESTASARFETGDTAERKWALGAGHCFHERRCRGLALLKNPPRQRRHQSSAGFLTCCIADFQSADVAKAADRWDIRARCRLKTCDTAGLETCATPNSAADWKSALRLPAAFLPLWALCLAILLLASPANASFVITEFMAVNNTTLNDEDRDNSDWIEIHNEGTTIQNLAGWYLTDSTNNLAQWQFPATNVPPNGYLVVFASGKNRRDPGEPLHTNFRLSGDGEYLALVRPDGVTVATEFSPAFPPQIADVSYGFVRDTTEFTLVHTGAPVLAHVPSSGQLGLSWIELEFDDANWLSGTSGVGYDRQLIGVNFLPFIGLNVEAAMYNVNQTIYVRVPFTVENPAEISTLTLRVMFDDGFVAYLNGQEVASSNAPSVLAWNSAALGPRSDVAATNFVDFDISAYRGFLMAGPNVLSFHALNVPVTSPDLLLVPELRAGSPAGPPVLRYFPAPTPGEPNNDGVVTLGPIISQVAHTPELPGDHDTITVTARVRPIDFPVGEVRLHYRVMFGAEVTVPMFDNGEHGDGEAGDGIYGARIPAAASNPGQMVRYYITATDTSGTNHSRLPTFLRPLASPAYFGTVIANPGQQNALPVFHWFVQNVSAADTRAGTRASVFWNGEFYDNVFCRIRGASAPAYPKKPYKFDFNPGHHFRMAPDMPRVDEINVNATYQDKAYVRQSLTFETYQNAGTPASDTLPVRVQQNGAFFSVAVMIEQVDRRYLRRRGLDPDGALYKLFNGLSSSTSGVEKRTRRHENNSDLQQLVSGVSTGNPNRGLALFDLVDLPATINYLAAGTVAQDWDRIIKNLYVYRDTEGTGQWTMLPWDKDLSFGKVGLVNDTVTAIRDTTDRPGGGEPFISHPFYGTPEQNCCGMNHLFDAIYKTPLTRQMYLRRLRSLMDELLQPPGTPANELKYERRIDEMTDLIRSDAALDLARWGAGYGVAQSMDTAIGFLKTNYLAARRTHLFQSHNIDSIGIYPQAVGIPHSQPAGLPLNFGVIEFNPVSGNQDEEFIELLNANSIALDVSGWRLAGAVEFAFAPGTVVPANSRIYVSPDVAAFLARATGPRRGQGLFVVGHYDGRLSARGETLYLFDPHGRQINVISYEGAPSPAQRYLRVTEIMYHPARSGPESAFDKEDYEFIKLTNIGTEVLDLNGVKFVNGIQFSFSGSAVTNLLPGDHVVVVKNIEAFTERYGEIARIAGEYEGNLSNSGERLRLDDSSNEKILDFDYSDRWYPITDGHGFSLVIVDPHVPHNAWDRKSSWRPSGRLHGSPAGTDPEPPAFPPLVIDEVVSRPVAPMTDSVELHNPTEDPADISGWFLTDNFGNAKKYRIPNGTVIPARGYLVFNESHFNVATPGGSRFAFSSGGEEVYLFSGDPDSNDLTGYFHGFEFGASERGVSFGRHVISTGKEHFVAQREITLGAANAGPRAGPIVISEIMYHAAHLGGTADEEANAEYLELHNITDAQVELFDSAEPANTWRLENAVRFSFPPGASIPAGGLAVLVRFDPADAAAAEAFRARHGVGENVSLYGPWSGRLDNSGESIEIYKPDAVQPGGPVLYVLVDQVEYSNRLPWPVAADGTGLSLQRIDIRDYGNDPINWRAARATPGEAFDGGPGPVITMHPASQDLIAGQAATLQVIAQGSGPFRYQWRLNGSNLPGATNDTLSFPGIQPRHAGEYVAVVINESGGVASQPAILRVLTAASITLQPQSVHARPGSNVTLRVQASSSTPITYQWRLNGNDLPGQTNTTLLVPDVQVIAGNYFYHYDVVMTDAIGPVVSQTATITVLVNPTFLEHPQSQTAVVGGTVTFTARVSGTPPFGHRWRKGFGPFVGFVPGQPLLTITNVQLSDAGTYSTVVTNAASPSVGVLSSAAVLTVLEDTDRDGMPDEWEQANGFDPNDPGDADLDSDGDGMSNREEYIAGTDPRDPESYLKVDAFTAEPGSVLIGFHAVSNRTYTVQYQDALSGGLWLSLTNLPTATTNRLIQLTDREPGAASRFYRLVTPQQPWRE
jgi:hypothetical protein